MVLVVTRLISRPVARSMVTMLAPLRMAAKELVGSMARSAGRPFIFDLRRHGRIYWAEATRKASLACLPAVAVEGRMPDRYGLLMAVGARAVKTNRMARLRLFAEVGFIQFVAFEDQSIHVAMGQFVGDNVLDGFE